MSGKSDLGDEFDAVLTQNINKLYDSYKLMLEKSMVDTSEEAERQLLRAAVSSVSSACQCLLDQIQELRMHAVVGGEDES